MGQGITRVLGGVLRGVFLAFLIAGCSNSGGTNGQGATAGGSPTGGSPTGGSTQTPAATIVGDATAPTGVVANPNPDASRPVGNIQGVVRDAVTGFGLAGARVSLAIPGISGDTVVTTGLSGQYAFANVPASLWGDGSGVDADKKANPADGVVQFGELSAYTVTVDLGALNNGLPAGDNKYPGQAFADAVVGFASFQDGNNALLCQALAKATATSVTCSPTEGGSGASTPVNGLTTTLDFVIGRLTEVIRGRVRDAQNGQPLVGATLVLLDASISSLSGPDNDTPAPLPAAGPLGPGVGIRLTLANPSVTTATDGTFTFPGVPAVHRFQVVASVPNLPPPAGYVPVTTAAFSTLGSGVTVLVPATKASDGNGNNAIGTPGTGEIFLAPGVPGVDSVPPYVISANPADGADIDVTAAGNPRRPIILCFSELMQTDLAFTKASVTTVDFKGLPTPGTASGVTGPDAQVQVTQAWTQGGTACPLGGSVLTITPVNAWQAGVTYGVFVGTPPPPLVAGAAPLADLAGNQCCRDISLNVLGTSTGGPDGVGRVFGEAKATPTTLLFTTNGGARVLDGPPASLAANSADFNTSTATITWTAVTDARAYEVYMSIAGGDFQLIARTAASTSPVTQMISRSWSFDDALSLSSSATCSSLLTTPPTGTIPTVPTVAGPGLLCTGGINPSNPIQSVANPNPRVAPGFDLVSRRILESVIPDVVDDVSTSPPTSLPTAPGATFFLSAAQLRSMGGSTFRVDAADGLADMSDNFGAASQVRIAIAAVNSNGVVGSLGTPVVVKDNTGPQTNSTQNNVPDFLANLDPTPGPVAVVPNSTAGATGTTPGGVAGPAGPPRANAPGAWTGQGEFLQDRLDPNDVNGNGKRIELDGVPDTIILGFSEPLTAASATCSDATTCATKYTLRDVNGATPDRLAKDIVIVSATYDEDANGNGVLDSGEDINGNGVLDRGSDANFVAGATNLKGNFFGNTFVSLRIAPATAGGRVDIRDMDYVALALDSTGKCVVQDLAGNGCRPVDPTIVQNQLKDITPPAVLTVARTDIVDNAPGNKDVLTINFSEPMKNVALLSFTIRGHVCFPAAVMFDASIPSQAPDGAFKSGASSVRLLIDPSVDPLCDLSRLDGDGVSSTSDRIIFTADTTDLAGTPNPLDSRRADTLLYNRTSATFVPVGSMFLPKDIIRPALVSATITNNAPGTPDVLLITFSEPLFEVADPKDVKSFISKFLIRGVDCLAAGTVVPDPNAPFRPGDSSVRFLVDATQAAAANKGARAACDLSQLAGDGSSFLSSDTIVFDATKLKDISGNTLNKLSDTLLFNSTTGRFVVTGSALNNSPQDNKAPIVSGATATNNAQGALDVLVISFSEPMQSFRLSMFSIGGVDCLEGRTINETTTRAPGETNVVYPDPNQPFRPGDTRVQLLVSATGATQNQANSACDLSRLAGDGTTFLSSATIRFERDGTKDVAGNALNPDFDTLLFSGTPVAANAAITGSFVVTGSAIGLPQDAVRPQVASATITNNAPGTPDVLVITFNERMRKFSLTKFNISGTDCLAGKTLTETTAAHKSDDTNAVYVDTNTPFRPGDTTLRLLVDSTVKAGCDVSRLVGDGATFASSDTVQFDPANTTDVAGNLLNPDFDTLLFNATTGNFVVTGSAIGLPLDITAPRLLATATITNNTQNFGATTTGANPDVLVLNFDEPMRSFKLTKFSIGGVDCLGGGTITVDETTTAPATAGVISTDGNTPFRPGDRSVQLLVRTPDDQVSQTARTRAACDLARLAGDGTTFLSSDTIQFERATTKDVAGNLLNPDFDTLLFNGTPVALNAAAVTGSFRVTGTQIGMPQDTTQPTLATTPVETFAAVAASPAAPATPTVPASQASIRLNFSERVRTLIDTADAAGSASIGNGTNVVQEIFIGNTNCTAQFLNINQRRNPPDFVPVSLNVIQRPFVPGDTFVNLVWSGVNAGCNPDPAVLNALAVGTDTHITLISTQVRDVAGNELSSFTDVARFDPATDTWSIQPQP